MKNKKKILAIIPARKGSKGLKNKNILPIGGKTLIELTILNSKKSKLINKISISTDSKKIQKISKKHKVWCKKLRPSKYSQNNSKLFHAIDFVLKNINFKPDIIVELHPTHVLRSTALIDKAIKYFLKNFNSHDSLISVIKVNDTSHKDYIIKIKNKKISFKNSPTDFNRQKLSNLYRSSGIILISKYQDFKKNRSMVGKKCLAYIVHDKIEQTDINDIYDYKFAKSYLK